MECMEVHFDKRRENNMVKRKERFMVDVLEPTGEEGRDKLRKASGRSTYPVIRR